MPRPINRKILTATLIPLAILGLALTLRHYRLDYAPNTLNTEEATIHIPTGATFEDVLDTLNRHSILKNGETFATVADRLGYRNQVKAGRYTVKPGTGNRKLVQMLKLGLQRPLMITFNNIRTPQQLAGRIAQQIEADSLSIIALLTSERVAAGYGFDRASIIAMCIPNTYEFYWNTGAKGFLDRMRREYGKFWNSEREAKAIRLGLTKVQVSTLASIVEEETRHGSEKAKVAGVYINRLNRGIPLQADPTVKFAVGDFTLRRVLTKHLAADSPYNTYRQRGLPPGPIRCPSIGSIDAVLNAEKHSYLYFCAKPDFSGYHSFAKTLAEHNRNAEAYRKALNRERIYR